MKVAITLFIFFFSFLVKAESFAEEHYRYDLNYKMMQGYYNRGLYQEATQYVDSLEGNRYVNGQTYYLISRIYSLNNQFDKTLYYLEKCVKRGTTITTVEKMYDLDKFRASHLYVVFELNYEKWHQEYVNWTLKLKLDSVYYEEIKHLQTLSYQSRYEKVESIDGDEVFELKDSLEAFVSGKEIDSINFETLTQLIIEKGFPTYRRVGTAGFDALRMLKNNFIKDFNKEGSNWEKIKPLLLDQLKEGNLKPFIYGQLEDRDRIEREEPQIYYTSLWFHNPENKDFASVEKPEELNIRRRKIGLCPIGIEYWSYALELPIPLQEIKFK